MRLRSIYAMAFFVWLGGVGGCVGVDAPGTGELSLHLVGSTPSGTIYRLRTATITVQGPSSAVFHTDDHPDQTSLSANVPTGDYLAFVADGWQLERLQDSTATPVDATLISDNPAPFSVLPHQRTTVPLRFDVQGNIVDMTQGYDIIITVDEISRFEPIADATVAADTPATKLGTEPFLFTYGSSFGVTMRSLLQFDLAAITPASQVRSAHLNLVMVDQAGIDFAVQVHEVLDPWSETSVTWDTQPAFRSDVEASLDFQGLGLWRFDVTALVQRWITAPGDNHGLVLVESPELFTDGGRFARFDSREATNRPVLEIEIGN